MTTPLIIIGCGGFGRQVHDLVDDINDDRPTWDLLGYVDDAPSDTNLELVRNRGVDVLGGLEWFESSPRDIAYVIGVGSPSVKAHVDQRLRDHQPATLIHSSVVMGFDVRIGAGSIICARSCLMTNIRTGRHVHINFHCSVGHDVRIGNYVSVNPLAAISGCVDLKDGVLVGTQATILQNIEVGVGATVGASACVTSPVPDGATVVGVPAVNKVA